MSVRAKVNLIAAAADGGLMWFQFPVNDWVDKETGGRYIIAMTDAIIKDKYRGCLMGKNCAR